VAHWQVTFLTFSETGSKDNDLAHGGFTFSLSYTTNRACIRTPDRQLC
jgi:hypothetical protein